MILSISKNKKGEEFIIPLYALIVILFEIVA